VKRCTKAANPPPCFTEYLDQKPDATWEQFRDTAKSCDHNKSCYHALRAQLLEHQGGLCAYCERAPVAGDQQVAHFHPKSDRSSGTNWGLHWPNLWLACSGGTQRTLEGDPEAFTEPPSEHMSCDTAKEDRILDDVILAPDQIPAFPPIFRFEQHHDAVLIVPDEPNCALAGIDPNRARATIEHLNLNCRRLTSARLKVHRVLQQAIAKARRNGRDIKQSYSELVRAHLERSPDGSWKRFFTLVRWTLRAPAEDYLREVGFHG
jgi:uncharacterized protein (TIGR02646 family)